MIQDLVEAIVVGACHELRSRPAPWLARADWNRANALAVIEFYEERARRERERAIVLGAVLGGGAAIWAAAVAMKVMRRAA